jgi:hypothetical protein
MFGGISKWVCKKDHSSCIFCPLMLDIVKEFVSFCTHLFFATHTTPQRSFPFQTALISLLQCCLRIDAPQTWANPKSQKIVLCFMDEGEYFKAARSIREAQYEHFCRARLESQPAGAIEAEDLLAAFSRSVSSGSTDIKVKIGDGEEGVKCVSVDGEVLIIESKSKGFAGVLRSKRMMISTPGLPIVFLNSSTIAVPNRDANITFSFPDSFNRDIFALKLYFHSKGDPKAAWFSSSASGPDLKVLGHLDSDDVYLSASPLSTSTPTASSSTPIASLLRTRSIKSLSTDTALISRYA